MAADTLNVEQFTQSVAEQIASKFNLEPSRFLDALVQRITDKIVKQDTTSPIQQEKREVSTNAKETTLKQIGVTLKVFSAQVNKNFSELKKAIESIPDSSTGFSELKKAIESIPDSSTGFSELKKAIESIPDSSAGFSELKKAFEDFSLQKQNVIDTEAEREVAAFGEDKPKEPGSKFAGFTPDGLRELKGELPAIIRAGVQQLSDQIEQTGGLGAQRRQQPGEGMLGGWLPRASVIKGAFRVLGVLGGILTLLYGLETEGPFKGLAKIASRGLFFMGGLNKAIKNVMSLADNFIKNFWDDIIKVPINILKTFSKAIGGIFGKEAAKSVFRGGLGVLKNFIPTFLKGALGVLKKVPIIGALISLGFAVSRFKSGDIVGGGLDILSGIASTFPGLGTGISIAIDALNAFLDYKAGGIGEGKKGKGEMIMDWFKGMGAQISEKVTEFPIIGPLLKSIEAFKQGNWLEGLKQFAYINPLIQGIGMLFESDLGQSALETAGGALGAVGDWLSGFTSWVGSKVVELPIIGPLIKGIQALWNGDWLEAFTQLQNVNPMVGIIKSFLTSEAGQEVQATATKAVDVFGELKNAILGKVLEFIPETVLGYPLRAKVAELLGIGPSVQTGVTPPTGAQIEQAIAPKQVGDAKIKPDGGLVVSSPTEGSLFQLSKSDGIVAAPFGETATGLQGEEGKVSFQKAESILQTIANNTGVSNQITTNLVVGFNNLARALEGFGAKMGENIKVPPIPPIVQPATTNKTTSVQYAKIGNTSVADYRNYAELRRAQPA